MIPRLRPAIALHEIFLALAPGKPIESFEQAFAEIASSKHAVAFPYGRTALMILLEALNLKEKRVLCPAYTCVVVPHAITFSGNEPVFVDNMDGSFLMDLKLAADAASEDHQISAIIATSLFGTPIKTADIDNFASQHQNVHIIQDCAHSFFCEDDGLQVHKQGIAAIYGLNFSKIITSVFGGIVTTEDDELAERLRALRAKRLKTANIKKSLRRRLYYTVATFSLWPPLFRVVNLIEKTGLIDKFVKYYDANKINMPDDYLVGMTNFEAAIGIRQCRLYAEIVSHRKKIAQIYDQKLKSCDGIKLPLIENGHTFSHYTIITERAEYIRHKLEKAGVELGVLLDYSVPKLAAYGDHKTYGTGNADMLVGRTLNLPVHKGVTPKMASLISDKLKNALNEG